ncbi:hypothetical protein ACFE04_014411 [Oxalis oulophora]
MESSTSKCKYFIFLLLLLSIQQVVSYEYKVGDLDAWGFPTSANPLVYTYWAKYHPLKLGDSVLFLYPPSEDSVIQVTEEAYNSCNITDPILYMNNGNSLFNITKYGVFYFTSGQPGHCEKKQKLRVSVSGNGTADAPDPGTSAAAGAGGPSYQNVFGSIPAASSSTSIKSSVFFITTALVIGSALLNF